LRLRDILDWLQRIQADRQLKMQIDRVDAYLQVHAPFPNHDGEPVLFFNASTRIHRLSINAAFSLLASWGIRQEGTPVFYAVCQRGMEQCILGTNRDDYASPPPCKHCIPFSRRLFPSDRILPLILDRDVVTNTRQSLQAQSTESLTEWRYHDLPLGQLCIPSLRWALRRHRLPDDEPTEALFRKYLVSAASLTVCFDELLERIKPKVLVVFNGISYPEAVARQVARNKGIPVITHEVGLRPYSAFFTYKDATFREVDLSILEQPNQEQEDRLNAYLSNRFKGQFTMAGIKFWPEMTSIPDELQERIHQHQQLVPIFTNVIFDTSQIHANTLYEDMFAWLDDLENVILDHPQTFFVIRAHPDEDRPGKQSMESVRDWFMQSRISNLGNVQFFSPSDTISSYDLIRQAKVVLVYNSSIGLEASILGAPVLCAGRARYTQIPTTFFPADREEYIHQLQAFLASEKIMIPPDFSRNARRFLYHELYQTSLDVSEFLRPYPNAPGMTLLTDFSPESLRSSPALNVITKGILEGAPFVYTQG
jgi:hypothetical protein